MPQLAGRSECGPTVLRSFVIAVSYAPVFLSRGDFSRAIIRYKYPWMFPALEGYFTFF